MGARDVDFQGRSPTWFTPYYFSIVTFKTLGFGDVVPKNLAAETWLTIEVVIGYIAIFETKWARRSA
jgi:CBS domain containing-hemolysin-like protein